MSQKVGDTLRWAFWEPRHLWFCVFVCVAAIVVVFCYGSGAEPVVRLAGMTLQLLGIVTVIWGIVETRNFFGLQSPLKSAAQWLSRNPLSGKVLAGAVAATEASDSFSARVHSSWPIDPAAPIEQRVSALEHDLPMIHERITTFQAEFDQMARALKEQLRSEEELRLALSHNVHSQLKAYGTGGLHISAIGAVWVFLGTVLGTASVEIAALLK